jgi:O-antigen/teichoic acid export membrane protein
MIVSSPLLTIQTAMTKYTAEFNAELRSDKVIALSACLLRIVFILAVATIAVFSFLANHVMLKLNIQSISSGYILALLLGLSWVLPVLYGQMQGLELFGSFSFISVAGGSLKLVLAFIFIALGLNIAGALGALAASNIAIILLSVFTLRRWLSLRIIPDAVNLKDFMVFLLPIAVATFFYNALVNMDMVLVKYFFTPDESGVYSLAQMVGKIFLFLPSAIAIVMFPRTSSLNAKNLDTRSTLWRSLLYTAILCASAFLVYNIFPGFILKILTGKVSSESVILGRLFSVSMSFFSLLFMLVAYFLSLKDLRFIRYLCLSVFAQFLAIMLFHRNILQVQLVLCLNSAALFCVFIILANKRIK